MTAQTLRDTITLPVIDATPVLVPVTYEWHACRYCGCIDCRARGEHDTLLRANETYIRTPVRERNACPRCGDDVRFGGTCTAVEAEWVTS